MFREDKTTLANILVELRIKALIWCIAMLIGVATTVRAQAGEKPLISKHKDGLTITMTAESGRVTEGKNSLCVLFQNGGHPAQVGNVRVEFTLLAGRNRGQPTKAQMTESEAGRYCGKIDL